MRHYTTNPAERAADIANREMEAAYKERRLGGDNWAQFWLRVYHDCLEEFAGQLTEETLQPWS